MFKLTLAASLLALAVAQYGPAPAYGGLHGGPGYGQDAQLPPTPYQYAYDFVGGDPHSGDFRQTRQESGDGHGNVKGSYGYTDAQGNQRQVDYVADGHGFRAQIRTNEPGTDNQSPADVQLHVEPRGHQAPAYGPPSPSFGHAPY